MHLDQLPRYALAQLPTPIQSLPALTRALGGPELLIKRADQTGLAFGGNKTRKLEFLVGKALAQSAAKPFCSGRPAARPRCLRMRRN